MNENLVSSLVTVVTAIIGVAVLAVIVSKSANTAGVIQAGAQGLATDIGAAVSPVTGAGTFNGLGGAGIPSFQ